MWKKVYNSNDVKPDEIDKTSSAYVVYIRKDFEPVTEKDEQGNAIVRWSYMEMAVPKENWAVYEEVMANSLGIADLEDAICELTSE